MKHGVRHINLFTSTLDVLSDGVLLVDGERNVIYYNEAFSDLWNIPKEIVSELNSHGLLKYVTDQLKDAQLFLETVERLYQSKGELEEAVHLSDGRVL